MNTHTSVQNCKSISGILAIVAACCLLLPFVSLSGCAKEDTTMPQAAEDEGSRTAGTEIAPTDRTEPAAEGSDDYEEVNPSELALSIKGAYFDSVVNEDGTKPVGGTVGEFRCKGLALQLASNAFDDGFILTKDYGKIGIRFPPPLIETSFTVRLTPKQKSALEALRTQIESANALLIAQYSPILEKNCISSDLIARLAEGAVAWADVSEPEQEILIDILTTTPGQLRIQQLPEIAARFAVRAQRATIEENRLILGEIGISMALVNQVIAGGATLAEASETDRMVITNTLGASASPDLVTIETLIQLIEKFKTASATFAERLAARLSRNEEIKQYVYAAMSQQRDILKTIDVRYHLRSMQMTNFVYAIMHMENEGRACDLTGNVVCGRGLMRISKPAWDQTVARMIEQRILAEAVEYEIHVYDPAMNIRVGVAYAAHILDALNARLGRRRTKPEELLKYAAVAYFDGMVREDNQYYRDVICAGNATSYINPETYAFSENVYAICENITWDQKSQMVSTEAVKHIRKNVAQENLRADARKQLPVYETRAQFAKNPRAEIERVSSEYEAKHGVPLIPIVATLSGPRDGPRGSLSFETGNPNQPYASITDNGTTDYSIPSDVMAIVKEVLAAKKSPGKQGATAGSVLILNEDLQKETDQGRVEGVLWSTYAQVRKHYEAFDVPPHFSIFPDDAPLETADGDLAQLFKRTRFKWPRQEDFYVPVHSSHSGRAEVVGQNTVAVIQDMEGENDTVQWFEELIAISIEQGAMIHTGDLVGLRVSNQEKLIERGMWVKPELTRQVTDQVVLGKIALEALNSLVRCAAVEKLKDQSLLAKFATADEDASVRRSATEKLIDQALLARIAASDEDRSVRRSATEKLTDPKLLTEMGMWVKPELTRQVTDQVVLGKIALEARNSLVRRAAVEKLNDQAVLVKIAVVDKDEYVRIVAREKLTDQAQLAEAAIRAWDVEASRAALEDLTDQDLLVAVAEEARLFDFCLVAIGKISDQMLLRRLAEQDPRAAIRTAVVPMIAEDRFLVQLLKTETSATVRAAIVGSLNDTDLMREVAGKAYHQADRLQALQRMKDEGHAGVSEIASAHNALAQRTWALAFETDNRSLLSLAIAGEFDVLRSAAARQLNDGATLEQAALHATDREVLRILLLKLGDMEALSRIAADADDRAMRLAAAQRAGEKSWQEIFDTASSRDATVKMLGDALGAVSLFSELQSDAKSGVQEACLNLIRRGDESRIPEMVDLLEKYGGMSLAEDYLNCGQPDLDDEAREWAHRRGLPVTKGSGSNRARWGSGRW